MRESVKTIHSTGSYYDAQILKVHLNKDGTYHVEESCHSEKKFEGDSKGFEGATSIRGKDGTLYLLGLCEGNHCREGAAGKEAGNGRIVVMAREETKEGDDGQNSCRWKTVTTLELPATAAFIDYSAIALHHSTKTVAVTSQENSQVWIGALSGGANGDFVPEEAKFEEGANAILDACAVFWDGLEQTRLGADADDENVFRA